MALAAQKIRYTFADCLSRKDETRLELIDGELYFMAPPSRRHQDVSGALFAQLYHFLEGKPCKVYAAPFAVRLFEQKDDAPEKADTMVEPDISVICDSGKLDQYGCKGAPDLVIEILSPSTRRHDRLVKLRLYQRAGVREYWIADPESETVQVFLLAGNLLLPHEEYGKNEIAKVNVLDGCFIELSRIFPEQAGQR